jgi:hypothetical protein
VSTAVFGTRANDDQICLPFSCGIHDFALWAALSLERFGTGELAQPFIKDILCRRYFGLAHLLLSRGWGARWAQKTLAKVLNIMSWAEIRHIDKPDGERRRRREHFCCLADLVKVRTVKTT